MRRHRTLLIVVSVVVALLIAGRLSLPYVLERTINNQLAQLEDAQGGIQGVSLSILRGAAEIQDLELTHHPTGKKVLHVAVKRIGVNMSWARLLRGRLVCDVLIDEPRVDLLYVSEKEVPPEKQIDVAALLQKMVPFRIDSVLARNGLVTIRTLKIAPENALTIDNLSAQVQNITNMKRVQESSFATFQVEGQVEGSAPLMIKGRVNPTAQTPTFELSMTLRGLDLQKLNPWLEEYITAKASAGTLETYAEVAAADGKFKGYVRPFALDLKITSVKDSNALQKIWAGIVDFAGKVLENKSDQQDAARVPISGSLRNPNVGVLPTILSAIRNAFIAGLVRSLEGSVSIQQLQTSEGKSGR